MTLFGTTIGGDQMFSLVPLLVVLLFWIMVWRRQGRADRALNEQLRALKPPLEKAANSEESSPAKPKTGPWG